MGRTAFTDEEREKIAEMPLPEVALRTGAGIATGFASATGAVAVCTAIGLTSWISLPVCILSYHLGVRTGFFSPRKAVGPLVDLAKWWNE